MIHEKYIMVDFCYIYDGYYILVYFSCIFGSNRLMVDFFTFGTWVSDLRMLIEKYMIFFLRTTKHILLFFFLNDHKFLNKYVTLN